MAAFSQLLELRCPPRGAMRNLDILLCIQHTVCFARIFSQYPNRNITFQFGDDADVHLQIELDVNLQAAFDVLYILGIQFWHFRRIATDGNGRYNRQTSSYWAATSCCRAQCCCCSESCKLEAKKATWRGRATHLSVTLSAISVSSSCSTNADFGFERLPEPPSGASSLRVANCEISESILHSRTMIKRDLG
jgi:hypothetical protein